MSAVHGLLLIRVAALLADIDWAHGTDGQSIFSCSKDKFVMMNSMATAHFLTVCAFVRTLCMRARKNRHGAHPLTLPCVSRRMSPMLR